MGLFFSIVISLIFILFMAFIFIGISKFLKIGTVKLNIVIVLFTLGFVLYYIGYYEKENYIVTSAKAFFSSVQMLVLNNNFDGLVNPIIADSLWGIPLLSLISVLIFAILAQTLAVTLFKDFSSYISAKYFSSQDTYIILGYDSVLDQLIYDIKKTTSAKVFVFDDLSKKYEIIEKGYAYLATSKLNKKLFSRSKKLYVFCLSNYLHQNLLYAKRIYASYQQNKPLFQTTKHKGLVVNLYVRINDHDIQHRFISKVENLHFHFIHDHDLYIKNHLKLSNILEQLELDIQNFTIKKPFSAWLGGFYPLGESVFKHLVSNLQFVNKQPIFHLSDDSKILKSKLYHTYPEIDAAAKIHIVSADINQDHYIDEMLKTCLDQHLVLFSFADDHVNIDYALMVYQHAKKKNQKCPLIYCYLNHDDTEKYMRILHDDKKEITFFGSFSQHFSLNYILNDLIDAEAKAYHEAYQKTRVQKNPDYIPKAYEALSLWDKASNRAVASHFNVKRFLLGLNEHHIMKEIQTYGQFESYVFNKNENAMDILGETEHLRWNAFHYVNGWTNLPINESLKIKKTKCFETKRHLCLVPYNALDDLAEKTKVLNDGHLTPYKQYDIENFLLVVDMIKHL
jgi:hypothetical protein